jgi:hypothetical protein
MKSKKQLILGTRLMRFQGWRVRIIPRPVNYSACVGYNSATPTATGFSGSKLIHAEGGLQIPDTPITLSGAADLNTESLKGLMNHCPGKKSGINVGAGGGLELKGKASERAAGGVALYAAAGGGYNEAYNTPTFHSMWNWLKSWF